MAELKWVKYGEELLGKAEKIVTELKEADRVGDHTRKRELMGEYMKLQREFPKLLMRKELETRRTDFAERSSEMNYSTLQGEKNE